MLALTEIVSLLAVAITGVRLYKQSNAINVFIVLGGLLGLILLVALLLPNVPSAGQAAFRAQCMNNLKQIGLGLHHYYAAADALPPPASVSEEGIQTSWRIILAPYTELADISSRYDRGKTWDSAANLPVAQDAPYLFICPANENQKDEQDRYYSAYAIPIGPETVFSDSNRQSIMQFSGEQSSTVAIVEACGRNIVWTRPEDVDMQTLPVGINLPGFKPSMSHGLISSTHHGGANVMRLDGSVQFLNQSIDEKTLQDLLITRD